MNFREIYLMALISTEWACLSNPLIDIHLYVKESYSSFRNEKFTKSARLFSHLQSLCLQMWLHVKPLTWTNKHALSFIPRQWNQLASGDIKTENCWVGFCTMAAWLLTSLRVYSSHLLIPISALPPYLFVMARSVQPHTFTSVILKNKDLMNRGFWLVIELDHSLGF